MTDPTNLSVRIFADGADLDGVRRLAADPIVKGFTTNPTLMRQAGVADYERFSRAVLEIIGERPVSFEVFSDEPEEMERQAKLISTWGENVFVKIPIMNTAGESTLELVRRLSDAGVSVNVTAVFTREQIEGARDALAGGPASNISVFAGRIADAGIDPIPTIEFAVDSVADQPQIQVIWASPREVLNIVQAHASGCHIITVTHDLLKKLGSIGKDLHKFSLETVQMFHRDASEAGYAL